MITSLEDPTEVGISADGVAFSEEKIQLHTYVNCITILFRDIKYVSPPLLIRKVIGDYERSVCMIKLYLYLANCVLRESGKAIAVRLCFVRSEVMPL